MFFRLKTSGPRRYLQLVANRREGGSVRQQVIATLGRLDELASTGGLAALLASGARFCEKSAGPDRRNMMTMAKPHM